MTSERRPDDMDPYKLLAELQAVQNPVPRIGTHKVATDRAVTESSQYVVEVPQELPDTTPAAIDETQPVDVKPSLPNGAGELPRSRTLAYYDLATNTTREVLARNSVSQDGTGDLADELFGEPSRVQASASSAEIQDVLDEQPAIRSREQIPVWRRRLVVAALGVAAYGGAYAATGPGDILFHVGHAQARDGDVTIIDSMRGKAEADEQLRREYLDLSLAERALIAVKETSGDIADIWRFFR